MFGSLDKKVSQYLKNYDSKLLYKAFLHAYKYHSWEKSITWIDAIEHLLETSNKLAELSADLNSIIASLFLKINHNEKSLVSIEKKFWKEVVMLIRWVQEISNYGNKNNHANLFDLVFLKKFFKLAWKDIRVFLIKICERITTLEMVKNIDKDERIIKANETLNIYVPLIKILWIWKYIWNVEDLCYKYIDPTEFNRIDELVSKKKDFLNLKMAWISKNINGLLVSNNIEGEIESRIKTIYSINRKIKRKHIPLSWVHDLVAVRIIVPKKRDAYVLLWIIHSDYKSREWRTKDYISAPKPNWYQSIHTTVEDNSGFVFEVQIQTKQMYTFNMYGLASHNSYKWLPSEHKSFPRWMKNILAKQKQWFNWEQIIESLSPGIIKDNITCTTPKGKELELPKRSTIIDFAFKLHTRIGPKVTSAYVNDEFIDNLSFTLQDWDNVNLLLSEKNIDYPIHYFSYLTTHSAKKYIKSTLKDQSEEKRVSFWKILINEKLAILWYKPFDSLPKFMRKGIEKKLWFSNSKKLYLEVWNWNVDIDKILNILYHYEDDDKKYQRRISLKIIFKNKDYKNIQQLFDLFHNLDIHVIKNSYTGLKTYVDLYIKDLPSLYELIAEVSRLPNVFNVKRIFIWRVWTFLWLLSFVSLFIILSPGIVFFVDKQYAINEWLYSLIFYINIAFFVSILYFFKYIARVTLPGLLKRDIFWLGMVGLNTVILLTVIWESLYIYETSNTILFISLTLFLYWLTMFEYLDSKWFDNDNS